ncbi:hypothetical protein MMC09_000258, partial [Bachmanniomyces sp. S44760]|nr:hypothetical protein [Bachmanniomyces sp. S44760]
MSSPSPQSNMGPEEKNDPSSNDVSSTSSHHDEETPVIPMLKTESNIMVETARQSKEIDIEEGQAGKPVPPPGMTDPASFPDGGLEAWLVVFG